MGNKMTITEQDRVDIKDKQNLDIDPNLFNYLRRNVKFQKHYLGFDSDRPILSYIFDGEMRLVTSKKDVLNRIFVNLENKWVTDETISRRTIRKFINGYLDTLK